MLFVICILKFASGPWLLKFIICSVSRLLKIGDRCYYSKLLWCFNLTGDCFLINGFYYPFKTKMFFWSGSIIESGGVIIGMCIWSIDCLFFFTSWPFSIRGPTSVNFDCSYWFPLSLESLDSTYYLLPFVDIWDFLSQ